MIQPSVKKTTVVRPTYLSPYEESFVVATEEIEVAHGLPIDTALMAYELKIVVESVKEKPAYKDIAPQSASNYCCIVVKQVNFCKEAYDNQRKKIRTGLIKVSSLSDKISMQSDPRIFWIMFHKIDNMYGDIGKTVQASLLIQGLHVNFGSIKAAGTPPSTPNIYMPL